MMTLVKIKLLQHSKSLYQATRVCDTEFIFQHIVDGNFSRVWLHSHIINLEMWHRFIFPTCRRQSYGYWSDKFGIAGSTNKHSSYVFCLMRLEGTYMSLY